MRFRVLDSWRGILALLIALGHFEALWPGVNAPLLRNGYLAVDFFFVLSGFVMAHAYGGRVSDGTSALSFMTRRLGRVWPLHAAVLGALLLAQVASFALGHSEAVFSPQFPLQGLLTNLVFLQVLGFHDAGTWNFPAWSIAIEFWTYLLFAFTSILRGGALGFEALLLALAGGVAVAFLSPDFMSVYQGPPALARCVFGFFVGVAIHVLVARKGTPSASRAAMAELPVLALALVFIVFAGKSVWTMTAPLIFGGLVYIFSAEAGPVSRLLSSRPFLRIGAWSYSIYMVHAAILFAVKDAAKAFERLTGIDVTVTARFGDGPRELLYLGGPYATSGLVLVFLGLTIATAACTCRLIEDPGRRFFNRLAGSPSGRRARAVPVSPIRATAVLERR